MTNGNPSNSKSQDLVKQVKQGLKSGRLSIKSMIAIVLFGAIIMVFVFFGLSAGHHGAQGVGAAARVNNSLVSMADLGSEITRLEQLYAPLFGGQSVGNAQRQFLRQQALEALIVQELVFQNAAKSGILSTDAEIQNIIVKEIPAFQRDGRFQRELYFQLLEANRFTPAEFESKIRKERMNMRARQIFEASATPLQLEIQKLKTLREQKMNVQFAEIGKDSVLPKIKVSNVAAEMQKPEFNQKIEEYYNANKAEFATEAQVRAQHILIKADESTSESKALELANQIRARAETEDFSKLAKEFSQDTGSKDKGGDLGFFAAGSMVPEFEQAAFSQEIGKISEPVKSSFGFHIIKVTDKKEATQKDLSQVKQTIAEKILANEVYEADNKKLEEALAKGDSTTVNSVLAKWSVGWKETGFFDLSTDAVPGITSVEAGKAALAVSEAKPLFPNVVRDGAQKFVIQFKASRKETVEDSASSLIANLAQERASDLFGAWIEDSKKTSRIDRNEQAISAQ